VADRSRVAGYGDVVATRQLWVSYRAPRLGEIAGTQFNLGTLDLGAFGFTDPDRGNQGVTAAFIIGSNPNLKPETGNSRTLTLAYTSQALPGFAASLTNYALTFQTYLYS